MGFVPGKLRASALEARFATVTPLFVSKGTNETRPNTTLADDGALFLPVLAGATYDIHSVFFVSGAGSSTAGDFSMRWTFPTGATMSWGGHGLVSGVAYGVTTSGSVETLPRFDTTSPGATYNFGTPATNYSTIIGRGLLVVGSTAGNLKLQWAQRASSGTATILRAGSYLLGLRAA